MQQRKIVSIEQLRGVAALGVVLCHLAAQFYQVERYSPGPAKLFGWAGQVGVALFFVVSGFCIRLPMARARALGSAARLDAKDYLAHRALRILPPYWAALALSLLVGQLAPTVLVNGARGPLDVLVHMAGLHALLPSSLTSINGVFWTISLEIQFYLAYLLIANRAAGPRAALAFLALGLLTYGAASVALPSPSPWRLIGQASALSSFWQWYLGVLLADVYVRRPAMTAPALPVWSARAAALGLCIALGLRDPVLFNVHLTYWALPLAAAAVVASCLVQPAGGEAQGLFGAAMRQTGRLSYSLYLLHPLAIALVALAARQNGLSAPVATLLAFAGSLGLGWAGYVLIEQPLFTRKRRLGSTVEPSPVPAGE